MKLYEISETRLRFLEAIESGEIPEEAIADTLAGIDGEFDEKADDIACYIKSLLSEAQAMKAESDTLTERAAAKKHKADKLTDYLFQQFKLSGKSKLETARNVLSIRKNPPAVQIENEADFIDWAKKRMPELLAFKEPTPAKKAIGDLIKIQTALNPKYKLRNVSLVSGEKLAIK